MIQIGAAATVSGSGPFTLGTAAEAMFLLWAWAILTGVTAFTLATVIEQRNRAERRYRSEATERLRAGKRKLLSLERERMTREMHDGLGGQLVSILAMVERGLTVPSDIAEALRRAIDDIRIIIDSLDPATTDLNTSLGKLRARLEPLLRRNGISVTWNVDDELEADLFPPEAVLHMLRIIQEAVMHSLRHANASAIAVNVTLGRGDNRQLRISILDNGCGPSIKSTTGGRRIGNMNSRAEELGAEIRIEDAAPGTRVTLDIPVPH